MPYNSTHVRDGKTTVNNRLSYRGVGGKCKRGERNNKGIRRPTAAAAKDLGRVEDRHSIDVVVGK
jgi:hypothetical protein